MNADDRALQQLLAQNPLFSSATAEEAAYLLSVGTKRTLAAHEQLFAVGSPGSELFIVLDGSIHILLPSQDGDVLVERFRRGDILGEIAVLDDQPRTATGVAVEPAAVLAIGRDDFHAFLARFPRYRQLLIAILVQRLRRTSDLVADMLTVESGVVLPPDHSVEPRFQTTIVGYGRYGNNYIGPKYAKRGYPWDVVAIVDPALTPERFAVSVLGRSKSGTPRRWSFLQRDEATGAQYPNGWMYASADGPPPPQLHAVLTNIANDWTEEYLEFEADAGSIRAYWDEWGGADLAAQVDTWLRALETGSAAA